jgi:hypothetical protein
MSDDYCRPPDVAGELQALRNEIAALTARLVALESRGYFPGGAPAAPPPYYPTGTPTPGVVFHEYIPRWPPQADFIRSPAVSGPDRWFGER